MHKDSGSLLKWLGIITVLSFTGLVFFTVIIPMLLPAIVLTLAVIGVIYLLSRYL